MRIEEVMTRDPACCTPETKVRDVARMMVEYDCGEIPLVQNAGDSRHVVGVITDRDITVRCVARRHEPSCLVRAHMTPRPLRTVHPDDDVSEVVKKMEEAAVRRIPVVDEHGILVGIVAERDLAMKLPASEALPLRKRIKASSNRAIATVDAAID